MGVYVARRRIAPPIPDSWEKGEDAVKHALIIEDDPRIGDALAVRLARLGYRSFEQAESEEDGVAAAARRRPDLVVVGTSLASGSPIEAARRIAETADIPMLLVADARCDSLPPLPLGATLDGPYGMAELPQAVDLARQPAPIPVCA